MTFYRFTAALAATLLAGAPAMARADVYCPVRTSIFGTVDAVGNQVMTLHTNTIGYIHVRMNRPTTNAHGLRLRNGVFAGVYGCLEPSGRLFNAEEVTLATSPDAYARYGRHTLTVEGRVKEVQPGRVLISEKSGHGEQWIRTSKTGVHTGDSVRATGKIDPHNGDFVASGIDRTH